MRAFLAVATDGQQSYYSNTLRGKAVDEVNRMRQVAFSTPEDTSQVEGTYWFKTITQKINLLKKVEDKLASDLQLVMAQEESAAQTQEMQNIILAYIHINRAIPIG